ncbi:hypothetical protein Tco_0180327 [Tanacetum coccineum]
MPKLPYCREVPTYHEPLIAIVVSASVVDRSIGIEPIPTFIGSLAVLNVDAFIQQDPFGLDHDEGDCSSLKLNLNIVFGQHGYCVLQRCTNHSNSDHGEKIVSGSSRNVVHLAQLMKRTRAFKIVLATFSTTRCSTASTIALAFCMLNLVLFHMASAPHVPDDVIIEPFDEYKYVVTPAKKAKKTRAYYHVRDKHF